MAKFDQLIEEMFDETDDSNTEEQVDIAPQEAVEEEIETVEDDSEEEPQQEESEQLASDEENLEDSEPVAPEAETEEVPEEEQPTATPEPTGETLTLVVNGKSEDVPVNEVIRRAQLFDASSQAMRDSAKNRKAAESFSSEETQSKIHFANDFADNWTSDPVETLSSFAETGGVDLQALIRRLTAAAVSAGVIEGVSEDQRALYESKHTAAVAKREAAQLARQATQQKSEPTPQGELDTFGWEQEQVIPVYRDIWNELGLAVQSEEAAQERKRIATEIEEMRYHVPDNNPASAYRRWLIDSRNQAPATAPVKKALADTARPSKKSSPKPPGSGASRGSAPKKQTASDRADRRTNDLLAKMGFE